MGLWVPADTKEVVIWSSHRLQKESISAVIYRRRPNVPGTATLGQDLEKKGNRRGVFLHSCPTCLGAWHINITIMERAHHWSITTSLWPCARHWRSSFPLSNLPPILVWWWLTAGQHRFPFKNLHHLMLTGSWLEVEWPQLIRCQHMNSINYLIHYFIRTPGPFTGAWEIAASLRLKNLTTKQQLGPPGAMPTPWTLSLLPFFLDFRHHFTILWPPFHNYLLQMHKGH